MRKLNYLLLTMLMVMGANGLVAQDTITHFIISEAVMVGTGRGYFEFTNTHETDSVFLGDFIYLSHEGSSITHVKVGQEVRWAPGTTWNLNNAHEFPDKMLGPGDSYVLAAVQDGWNGTGRKHPVPVQSPDVIEIADATISFDDWADGDPRYSTYPYIPELGCFGFDSIADNRGAMFSRISRSGFLVWAPNDTLWCFTDQVLAEVDWSDGSLYPNTNYQELATTAGQFAAHAENILVRKHVIKEGETNWDLAKGSDPQTCSWILVPYNFDLGSMAYKTVGNHGNFTLEYSSDVYTIDEGNGTLSVPWGTEKFDSIIPGFNLGKGMAWQYLQNGSAEDSLSMVCKDGDTLRFIACGDDVQYRDLVIEVEAPLASDNTVFAKRQTWYPDPDAEDFDPADVANIQDRRPRYQIDEFETVMDTVGYVPFATPVDTFFRLLEKPENATWRIDFAGGEDAVEVTEGDHLVVTAENGSEKTYYIQVEDFVGSDNLDLLSITWPDRPATYMDGWGHDGLSDTIPGFSATGTSYKIILPPGSTNIPALSVKPRDLNTTVEMQRAISLKGGVAERTTTIILQSETDTSFNNITVVFDVMNPDPQKFRGDPIFSKMFIMDWWGGGGIEICNPSDYVVDFSNYMVVRVNGTTKAEGIEMLWDKDSTTWLQRYMRWVPGYKWGSWEQWKIDPGYLYPDPVNSFVEAKDVICGWKIHHKYDEQKGKVSFFKGPDNPIDVFFNTDFGSNPGVYDNPWAEPLDRNWTVGWPRGVASEGAANTGIYYLLKILNDSILLGSKKANDLDDFQIVDVFGSDIVPWNLDGQSLTRQAANELYRNPDVFLGDTVLGMGIHHSNPDSSGWRREDGNGGTPQRRTWTHKLFGSHPMDEITGHLSTIFSVKYRVSRGYSMAETIEGVSKGEDVATFLSNIIKANETQVLEVSAGGTPKAMNAAIAEGDILTVTSSSGNVSKYTISLAAIQGDASLTALDTTITVSEAAPFEVGGFAFGTSIETVLGKVVKADDAVVINVIDKAGQLVPLTGMNSNEESVIVAASANLSFEVIAEDGTTRIYDLVPASMASDAYLLSDIYMISETPAQIVSEVPFGTGVESLLDHIAASKGASISLLTATGQARESGRLGFGDQIIVTSEDQSMTSVYKIQFEGSVLAYVTSVVYTVDAENSEIKGVPDATDVSAFLENLVPSANSTMMLKDSTGAEKTSGTVLANDVIYVISGDKVNNVTYKIMLSPVSVETVAVDAMKVYPNPASSVLFVENVPAGSFVRVVDITGRTAMMVSAHEINRGMDLSNLSNGVYMLTVEKDGEKLMTTRFVKK